MQTIPFFYKWGYNRVFSNRKVEPWEKYKDIKNQMNDFDIGFNLRTGVYITEELVLDGRYYFGLANVNKTLFSDKTMSNNVLQIGLSYFSTVKDHQKTE